MNPWGLLFIVIGVLAVYIGVKGTQGSVYEWVTGHAPAKAKGAAAGAMSSAAGLLGK